METVISRIAGAIGAGAGSQFDHDQVQIADSATEGLEAIIHKQSGRAVVALEAIRRIQGGASAAVSGANLPASFVLGATLSNTRSSLDVLLPATEPTDEFGNPVNGKQFQFATFGTQALEIPETRLPEAGPYGKAKVGFTWATAQLETYGLAGFITREARDRAGDLLGLEAKTRALPGFLLTQVLWSQAATFLTTSGNFGTATAISGGSEWDASGVEPRTAVNAAVAALLGSIGGDPRNVTMTISFTTYNAIRSNAKYQASYSSVVLPTNAVDAELDRMAAFFGIGRVIMVNPYGISTAGGSLAALFSDVAILIHDGGSGPDHSDIMGVPSFARRFTPTNGPVALDPWYSSDHRVWYYPVEEEWLIKSTNVNAGYLLTNTAA